MYSFSCTGEVETCRGAGRLSRPPPLQALARPTCASPALCSASARLGVLTFPSHGTINRGVCYVFGSPSALAREQRSGADGAAIDALSEDSVVSLSRARAPYLLLSVPFSNSPSLPPFSFPSAGALSSSSSSAAQGKNQDPGYVVPPRRLLHTHPCSLVRRSARPRSACDPRSAISKVVRCVLLLVYGEGRNMPWRKLS